VGQQGTQSDQVCAVISGNSRRLESLDGKAHLQVLVYNAVVNLMAFIQANIFYHQKMRRRIFFSTLAYAEKVTVSEVHL
jgi:hypothetical protein